MSQQSYQQQQASYNGAPFRSQRPRMNSSESTHHTRQEWLKRRRLELVLQQEEILAALEGIDEEWTTWKHATVELYRSRPSTLIQIGLEVVANATRMRRLLMTHSHKERVWYHRYQALQAEDRRLFKRTHELNTQLDAVVRKLAIIDAEIL